MRIVFMGSAGFAVPSLNALIDSDHDILEVVCQPDKPAGRGQKITACPVAQVAREAGLPLYQPQTLKGGDVVSYFENLQPDIIVVVAYGKILPSDIIDIPPRGCVNLHSSLLPKYRGAAPINWAIIDGEVETGVTTMLINERMDAGDILLSRSVMIDELDDAVELEERLEYIGAQLLLDTLKGLEEGAITPLPQDEAQSSYAPLLKKEDGLIDWSLSAREIANRVRGLVPWPVAFTHMNGKTLRIFEAHASDEDCDEEAGTVIRCEKHLAVATGKGILYPIEVQLEGKKKMHCEDMLRGCKIDVGTKLK
jgi:methionyl-tRNA formyltransferase